MRSTNGLVYTMRRSPVSELAFNPVLSHKKRNGNALTSEIIAIGNYVKHTASEAASRNRRSNLELGSNRVSADAEHVSLLLGETCHVSEPEVHGHVALVPIRIRSHLDRSKDGSTAVAYARAVRKIASQMLRRSCLYCR